MQNRITKARNQKQSTVYCLQTSGKAKTTAANSITQYPLHTNLFTYFAFPVLVY